MAVKLMSVNVSEPTNLYRHTHHKRQRAAQGRPVTKLMIEKRVTARRTPTCCRSFQTRSHCTVAGSGLAYPGSPGAYPERQARQWRGDLRASFVSGPPGRGLRRHTRPPRRCDSLAALAPHRVQPLSDQEHRYLRPLPRIHSLVGDPPTVRSSLT